MSNTLKLIERVRSTTETGTNYAVAKALGMNPSNFMRVLSGKNWPGPAAQLRMAELLRIDLRDIVALINEDKAKSEADRAYWRSVCTEGVRQAIDAAGKAAAAFIIGTGLIGLTPRAQAEGNVQPFFSAQNIAQDQQVMPVTQVYIMRNWLMRKIKGLAARLHSAFQKPNRFTVAAMCPA